MKSGTLLRDKYDLLGAALVLISAELDDEDEDEAAQV